METIFETIAEKPYTSRVFSSYFGEDWCVLDIETTGLSPKTAKVILVGLAFPEKGSIRAVQLFAHSRGEEEELLLKLNELMNRRRTVITYNGAAFDLPFLEYRYQANRIKPSWLPAAGLDLYRACRYHSPLKQILPNLKQKSVEVYMGLSGDRSDEIDGAESVRLYEEYEIFSNPEDREKILLHNRDDILQLSRLMGILDKLDLHRVVFYEALSVRRKNSRDKSLSGEEEGPLIVRKCTPSRHQFTAEGIRYENAPDYYGFEAGYNVAVHGGKFRLNIPGETIEDCFVVNLADIFPALFEEGAVPGAVSPEEERLLSVMNGTTHREGTYLILTEPGTVHFREANALVRGILSAL